MKFQELAKMVLTDRAVTSVARAKRKIDRARVSRLPAFSEDGFKDVLSERLGLGNGDTVYVHSAMDQLNLAFPFYRVLPLIQQLIGSEGTLLLPTYPNRKISSYEYLSAGNVFDIRRTPSYTGILTEFARRQRNAVRSLHPTKSVCAIGRHAEAITATHQNSPWPYDQGSPYYKLIAQNAKIIGLGVWTQYLSFVYCVDDALKEDPPVRTYYPQKFAVRCVNYEGEEVMVETYAHDMRRCVHDIPRYMRTYIPAEICEDITIQGMRFFRANASSLFEKMLEMAKQGITVYPRSVYSKDFLNKLK
jgi:aminoglycoside 3-N-acetyltransferase